MGGLAGGSSGRQSVACLPAIGADFGQALASIHPVGIGELRRPGGRWPAFVDFLHSTRFSRNCCVCSRETLPPTGSVPDSGIVGWIHSLGVVADGRGNQQLRRCAHWSIRRPRGW